MKRLLLLGGGHAHVKVLADLAQRPLAGWAVQLVSPYRRQIYSGMLPGWIAGHYGIDDCALSLDRLSRAAGVTFHETGGVALDPVANTVTANTPATSTRGNSRPIISTGQVSSASAINVWLV